MQPSYYKNELMDNTSITAGIDQRLLEKLHLGLSGGYRRTSYITADQSLTQSRKDDGFFFQARLSTALFKNRATAAIFYSWDDNQSNSPGYGYATSEVGFELGYKF